MSTTFKVKIIGLQEVINELEKRGIATEGRIKQALSDEANTVLAKSKDECPVLTGTMRRTGTAENPVQTAGKWSVTIGYNTTYAEDVHENMRARHKTGKAKFLEDPVNAAAPGMADRIARRIAGGWL